jgi:hypothetical protein
VKNLAIIASVRLRWFALALLLSAISLEITVVAPHPAVLLVVAALLLMGSSGVFLARRALGPRDPSGIAAWLVGPPLGFGFGVFGLLLLWAAGVHNWIAIVGGAAVPVLIGVAAGRWGGISLRVPHFDRRDVVAVLLLLLVVPLVTWAPYDHVRERVADGEAYRAYFTADFVWGMTVETELAKGQVPPANPFLRDAQLHYYWMSHLLSGALYRNVRALGLTAEQVLLVDGLAFGLAAAAFFYALARFAGANAAWAALAVAVGFLANSYEGFNRCWLLWQGHAPLAVVKTLNIDAVTRWFYHGMPVDGLQRMLLYQPHHLTGYMLALSALWIVGFADDVTETAIALSAGILLALGFLFSTFTTLIIGLAVAMVFALRLIQQRAFRAIAPSIILGGAPVAAGIGVSFALGYTDPNHSVPMTFGPNPIALTRWPLMLLLSFGPLLFVGAAGLARWRWVIRDGVAPAALVASALAFYFLVDVPDEGGVWVGWRSGHLLLIGFLVISAAACTAAWRFQRWRRVLAMALVLAVIPALPTVAIDVYNAQDITNRRQGPDFPWTLVISPLEREALEWVRHSTREDAIVQYEPFVRGAGWWCYITAFAERRMAAGLPGSMIPFKPYQMASDDVRSGIFRARSATDAHAMAAFLGIDYLLIGAAERRAYHPTLVEIAKRPDLFPQLFKNNEVTIYEVKK